MPQDVWISTPTRHLQPRRARGGVARPSTTTRRLLTDITREYASFDKSRLAVDELGDAISPSDALDAFQAALVDVDRSLGLSVAAIYTAMGYTSRLYDV
ncbi:MAG: hypothetical protein WA988_03480 [Candidatus Nanopelagicales bacterium]